VQDLKEAAQRGGGIGQWLSGRASRMKIAAAFGTTLLAAAAPGDSVALLALALALVGLG
jgi:hypothetical protein